MRHSELAFVACLSLAALVPWTGHAAGTGAPAKPVPTSAFAQQATLFAQKCAKCHTVGKGDRVGPDLKGITARRERPWLVGFVKAPSQYLESDPIAKELLEKYGGVRMDDLGLSTVQVEQLLAHIEELSASTVVSAPAGGASVLRDRALGVVGPDEWLAVSWPMMAIGLALAATGFIGLIRRRSVARGALVLGPGAATRRPVPLVMVLAPIVAGLLLIYLGVGQRRHHRLIGSQQGYAPTQPIAYSHALHAGTLGISCLYCHHGATKGAVAGVPSVSVCMNCHNRVKTLAGSKEPSVEIAKLTAIWENRADPGSHPPDWIRVHRLPDFVSFDHRAHVKNGIACQECHGPVQTMQVMRQASDLSMGWCVNCHRRDGAQVPPHWKTGKGPLDCSVCHQ